MSDDASEANVDRGPTGTDPATLADRIMADSDSPYWDSGHRDHSDTVKQVTELLKKAHGEDPVVADDGHTAAFHKEVEAAFQPPDTPDDYDFQIQLVDGEEYNQELDTVARDWLHEAGVPNEEAIHMAGQYRKYQTFSDEQHYANREETMSYMKKLWGVDFEQNMSGASKVARSLGPRFMTFLEESGMGNDRNLIQTLHRVAIKKGI